MRLRIAFVALACCSYSLAQCGGNTDDGDAGPDGTTVDVFQQQDTGGGQDVITPDDTGTGDETSTDAGSDVTDAAKTPDTGIGTWQCGSATVTSCTACIGYTQPCVYCAVADASLLSGVCIQTGTNCLNAIPSNQYQDCVCADAAACPEAFQVCTTNGRCHTCSDQSSNNNLTCENGGKCDYADGGCL